MRNKEHIGYVINGMVMLAVIALAFIVAITHCVPVH